MSDILNSIDTLCDYCENLDTNANGFYCKCGQSDVLQKGAYDRCPYYAVEKKEVNVTEI